MKTNRTCNYCGAEYYCCKSCISINSWKNVCCSKECYSKLMSQDLSNKIEPIEIRSDDNMLLRGMLKTGYEAEVIGYDLSLGKFDCADGQTRTFNDFKYFIISDTEMAEIGNKFNSLNENKQTNKISVSTKNNSKKTVE